MQAHLGSALDLARRLTAAATGTILLTCALLLLAGCASTRGHDAVFVPLSVDERIISQPTIIWEVRADVAQFCAGMTQMSVNSAMATPPVACAVWNTHRRECRIITGTKTSHALLGHELRHCFEGHFH